MQKRLEELRGKRTALIAEAQQVALLPEQTSETREKFKKMMADVEAYEADIANVERSIKLEAELRSTQKPPRPNPGGEEKTEEQERSEKRSKAFEKYIRFGERRLSEEERALLETRDITTTGAEGTVSGATLIPQEFLTTLIDARKLIGNTVSFVRQKVTNNNGAPIKVALSNDTANSLTTLTAESSVVAEQDPGLSGFVMSTDTVATLVKVSRQELADSYFDLATWLKEKFGLRYYRGLEYLITNGNGSNVAALPAGATAAPATAANTGPVFDDFTATYGALDPAYIATARWAFSSITRAYIMGLKDNYGRPLFIPSPNTGTLDQILGCPIIINQVLPPANVAGNTGVLFGDFIEGYTLRTDGEMSILRLDERFADTLEVGFIGYARVGGASTDAGTHPLLKMPTHA